MLKVLIAPLDWGLGHATRCVPIIKEFIIAGYRVIVAAGGAQKAILQEEFPAVSFVEIPGYRIKYTKNRAFTIAKIIWNMPKILIRIKAENRWLDRFLRHTPVDLVISDNRYGLCAAGPQCIFVTHQLSIRTGLGRLPDRWLQRANYAFINRFMACWVPDAPGPENLAGKLSHPRRMPRVPVRYIGWLSRFDPATGESVAGRTTSSSPASFASPASFPSPASSSSPASSTSPASFPPPPADPPQPATPVDLLLLLSGPEPQRTILEHLLLSQLETLDAGHVVLVRGVPGAGAEPLRVTGVKVHDYLGTAALATLIGVSKVVLSRPGFSTVMDLATLRKRAIFIPTPGQTEQEYLGRYLAEKGWAVCRKQRGLSLGDALAAARQLEPASWPAAGDRQVLRRVISAVAGQSDAAFG